MFRNEIRRAGDAMIGTDSGDSHPSRAGERVHVRSTERHPTPFTSSELMRFGFAAGLRALCPRSRALPSNTSNNALAMTRTKKYVTSAGGAALWRRSSTRIARNASGNVTTQMIATRSEEHTSELQSLRHLVC